ncbi:unnamed protein product, partial [Mesorhabditis belari]|uniref:Uncharacterized protein n=1 Tax=Mesorhabditis belari TaxID=2138241 RepID=A0AAF3EZ63_9BILA
MLSRKKHHPTPTFLEGTRGNYVRRASPPNIPSLGGRRASQQPQPETSQTSLQNSTGSSTGLSPRPHLAPLSSHSFSGLRTPDRGRLAVSQSIGNVAPLGVQENAPRISASLNNLPIRALGNSIIGNESLVSGSSPEDELPLPPNWAVEVTDSGYRYYVDHNNRRTHWLHPLARESLPPGWKKLFDLTQGVIYFYELENRIQLEHPGLQDPQPPPQQMPPEPRQLAPYPVTSNVLRAESTVENLNIIHGETPEWLRLYSQADLKFDNLLEWGLFSEGDLQKYSELMLKLHKQEVINVVIQYERLRKAILREIDQRAQGNHPLMNLMQPHPQSQPLPPPPQFQAYRS